MTKTLSPGSRALDAAAALAPPGNQAADYGASIQTVDVAPGVTYWKVVSVRHLSPDENRGRHNIYVDAVDEAGQRVRDANLRIHYTWEGRREDEPADPKPLDKPDNEPAGNLDVYKGQIITVWLADDGLSSDRVAGLHTDHDDEPASDGGNGNTRFHHSFYVRFQRAQAAKEPVIIEGGGDEVTPPGGGGQPPTLTPEEWVGVVTAIQLNLRQGPGTEHVQIGSLFEGDTVGVTGRVGEWLRVLVNGRQGFVHSQWVQRQTAGAGGAAGDGTFPPPAEQLLAVGSGASAAERSLADGWNKYGGLLLQHAGELAIDPGVALAVLMAESRAEPFSPDGRMIIRFENHIFFNLWGQVNAERYRQHFRFDSGVTWQGHQWRPDSSGAWQDCHVNQAVEWQVLNFARRLDDTAALSSISMGAPQIMGFNHRAIGYSSVQEMFHAFQTDVRNQISSLFRFIQVNGLAEAVRQGDYVAFARVYNGPGQAENYAEIIRNNLAAFQRLRTAPQAAPVMAALPMPMAGGPPVAEQLPMPPSPIAGKPLIEADPELYTAWRNHIIHGFENNQTMFTRTLNGFLNPYWVTVVMYGLLFLVGIVSFGVAVFISMQAAAAQGGNAAASLFGTTAIFGGLSVVAFLTFFLSRPLRALEENLHFIAWLGVVFNSYWTRLAYLQDASVLQEQLDDATNDTVAQIKEIIDKQAERDKQRPGLPLILGGG